MLLRFSFQKIHYVYILFLIMTSVLSHAHECSNIDLRPSYPAPVRDQGKISWCYAYTAADQLTFHEKSESFSAPHIALEYD